MPRDYRKMVRIEWRPIVRWLPATVVLGLALLLALRLLKPPATVVQTVQSQDGRLMVRLEKQRYVRRNDWVVRVRTATGWRTIFYWIPPHENVSDPAAEPHLIWLANTSVVALVVGDRVVWRYDTGRGTGN